MKHNEFNIPDTADEIIAILNLDEEKHDSVTSLLKRIQSQIRKSKKNVDQLNTEWWNCPIPWEPKYLDITPPDTSTSLYTQSNVKKNLFSLRLPQQRIRLSSILEQIRETATIEDSTPVEIAALALQLLANEVDNRKTAKVAKGIVSSGGFSGMNLNYVPVDKALFLLDLLEIGRRKYTQLRQTLLPENINFPSYSKVADLRNELVSRNLIQLYPGPHQPIGVQTPYFIQVQKTLERIISTLNPLDDEEYPLTFRIADGLDGSGCHVIYNQNNTNTNTKNLILFCFKPISICSASNRVVWQNQSPIPLSLNDLYFFALRKNVKKIFEYLWKI